MLRILLHSSSKNESQEDTMINIFDAIQVWALLSVLIGAFLFAVTGRG